MLPDEPLSLPTINEPPPPELIVVEGPRPLSESASVAAALSGSPSTPSEPDIVKVSKHEFLWNIHAYVNEYIRFADTKAGFTVALTSAVIWALVSAKFHSLLARPLSDWQAPTYLGALSLLMNAVSLFSAFGTVLPRRPFHPGEGLLFWGGISQHKTAHDYSNALAKLSAEEMDGQIINHLHTLSHIATKKYRWVHCSIISGAFGIGFGILALLFMNPILP